MDTWSLVILALFVILLPSFRRTYFKAQDQKEIVPIVKERQVFFDVLKGFAIIAVVLIHVTYLFNITIGIVNNQFFLNTLNNLSRFAIAFFFLCSGILLTPVNGKNSWKEFYKRKVLRILGPWLLVCFILFAFNPTSVSDFLYNVVTGNISVPFYFIIVLIQLYLLFPLLSRWRKSKYFLVTTFAISFIYHVSPLTSFPFDFPLFIKFLFFFSYGMYFREYYLNYEGNKKEFYVWLMILLGYVLIVLVLPGRYYNHRYFYGIALFNVLFYYKDKILSWKKVTKFFSSFGKNSLWIFLIHFSLMSLIYPWIINRGWNYYVSFVIFFVDSLIISYFGAMLCQWGYNYLSKQVKKRIV